MFLLDSNTNDLQTVRYLLNLLQPSVGAAFLLFSNYLNNNGRAKDKSLNWLAYSLFSWSLLGFLSLIWDGIYLVKDIESKATKDAGNQIITAVVSPIINIFFAITASQLLRVKEYIYRHNLLSNVKATIYILGIVSLIALVFRVMGSYNILSYEKDFYSFHFIGLQIDFVVSFISLMILGIGIVYSFLRYGNKILALSTFAVFVYFIWYQVYFSFINNEKLADNPIIISINILSNSVLIFLFFALTTSWSLSDTSRIKFIHSESVNGVCMVLDIRGSTEWALKMEKEGEQNFILEFKNKFAEWILKKSSVDSYDKPHLKFTGDGFRLVWETLKSKDLDNLMNSVARLAINIQMGYQKWVEDKTNSRQIAPQFIGIGIDCGTLQRLTCENGSVEYEGIAINTATKFQNLAKPFGGIVLRENCRLSNEIRELFINKGELVLENHTIHISATGEIKTDIHLTQ